jgi:hypothetical protein
VHTSFTYQVPSADSMAPSCFAQATCSDICPSYMNVSLYCRRNSYCTCLCGAQIMILHLGTLAAHFHMQPVQFHI